MEKLIGVIEEIKEGHKQESASQKDEVKVMRAMLNDKEYSVDVYGNSGIVGSFSPAEQAREVISSAIASTTKISQAEAEQLANGYEFSKKDAVNMINISKEFISVYTKTGRKLPLGGRKESNISLCGKRVEESVKSYPFKVGEDANGKAIVEIRKTGTIPAYDSIRVVSPCPEWLKEKK